MILNVAVTSVCLNSKVTVTRLLISLNSPHLSLMKAVMALGVIPAETQAAILAETQAVMLAATQAVILAATQVVILAATQVVILGRQLIASISQNILRVVALTKQ